MHQAWEQIPRAAGHKRVELGGFLLTWIWGLGNNVWISLISILDFYTIYRLDYQPDNENNSGRPWQRMGLAA